MIGKVEDFEDCVVADEERKSGDIEVKVLDNKLDKMTHKIKESASD